MKQFKKLIACVLAATLVLGSTTVFFGAETEKETSKQVDLGGSGDWEGTVDKEVFKVNVPTQSVTSASAFDFILDPEGLIKTTTGAAHTTASGEAIDFVTYGSMYFRVSDTAYDVKSQVLTAENKSSVNVNITLQASVTVPTSNSSVTFVTDDAWTVSDKGLEIYLAVTEVSGDALGTEVAIADKAENVYSATVTSSLVAFDAYEVVYATDDQEYQYVINEDTAKTVSADTYSFCLTGACNTNADWSGYVKDADPTIAIVWKVEMEGVESTESEDDVADVPAAVTSINNGSLTATYSKSSGITIPYTLASGTEIDTIKVGSTTADKTIATLGGTLTTDNGNIVITGIWTSASAGATRVLTITFTDETPAVTINLTIGN